MSRFRPLGLRPRLALSHAVLALALVVVSSLGLAFRSSTLRRDGAARGVEHDATVLAARAARIGDTGPSLDDLIEDERRGSRRVAVVASNGMFLAGDHNVAPASDMTALVADALRGKTSVRFGDNGVVIGAVPIVSNSVITGAAIVREHVPPIRPLEGPLVVQIGIGLLVVAAAAAGGWLLAGGVAKPLDALAERARRMALRGTTAELNVQPRTSVPEITTLAAAIDRMAERLVGYVEFHRRRERQQEETLRRVSHDLRTPLGVLLLRREELLSPDIDRERRAQVAEIVDRQLEQLQAAANELREVARHSELASTDRGVDLAQLIEVAVGRVRPLAGWSRVSVEAQAPDVPVTVAGDRNGLETAIANLLDNAVKYAPPGGHVVARCQPGERAVTVEIIDNGPGISDEERAAVLRPWSRGRSADGVRGSGLGLSLVVDVASALGGSFDLAPNPGGGTIARLVIPV